MKNEIPPEIRARMDADRAAAKESIKKLEKRHADLAQQLRTSSPDDDPEAIAKARGAAQDRQLLALEAAQHPNRAAVLRAIDDFSAKLESAGVRVSRGIRAKKALDPFLPKEAAGHTIACHRLITKARGAAVDRQLEALAGLVVRALKRLPGGTWDRVLVKMLEAHTSVLRVQFPAFRASNEVEKQEAAIEAVVCRGCDTVGAAATPGGDPPGWNDGLCGDCQGTP